MLSPGALCWLRPDTGQEGLCDRPPPERGRGASTAALLVPGAGRGFECPGAQWAHTTASGKRQPSRGRRSLPGRVCWDSAPPPAPGLPSGDPGRPCEAPRRCLQATVFEPHPVLVMLCPPLPPPQKLENIEFLFYFCLRMLSHLGPGGWCESRGVCKGSWAALVARCSLSSSVGGGLEPWAVQVPGCIRICEQQGCQLPAASSEPGDGWAGLRHPLSVVGPTVSACLSLYVPAWCWRPF